MTRKTIFRLGVAFLLPMLAFASAVLPQFARPGGVAAQTAGAPVSICGTISAYTAPSLTTVGSIAFSVPVTTFVIAAGATVSLGAGASTATNSNVCLVGLQGANNQLVSLTITANATTTTQVNLCGVVGAYVPASSTTIGSITIGGILYPIATNVAAFTGVQVVLNANICLNATLNALGQITGGAATANSAPGNTIPVNFCGTLSAYTAATPTATGSITVSSGSYVIAAGVVVGNAASFALGSLVCLVGQSNGTQLVSVSLTSPVSSTLTICGLVSAYNPPSTTGVGSVTIDGTTLTLAANAAISSPITVNTNLCFVVTLNSFQQATALAVSVNTAVTATPTATGTPATATPTATVTGTPPTATLTPTPITQVVCGVISYYLAATSTTNGTLTINGTVLGIVPGATFSGAALAVQANVCISAVLNSAQQITTAIVTLNAVTPTATTNVPPPPPPPGPTSTPTATATAVPPTATATATATAVPPTATPVPAQATPTPKPAKTPKPKPTATTAAVAPAASGPAPTPVPAPAKLPSTGFGGTGAIGHNVAVGRMFRSANGNVAAPLGIASSPATGGSDPLSPAVPAILGLAVIGFGVLARKAGIARR